MRLYDEASSPWIVRALACGGCIIAGLWIAGWILGRLIGPMKVLGQGQTCGSNLIYVTRGFRMYADDYDGLLPPSSVWMDGVQTYLDGPRRLHCPSASKADEPRYGYAMNSAMSQRPRADVEGAKGNILVYDSSNLNRNAADPLTSLPRPGRHRARAHRGGSFAAGNNVGFANGRVVFRPDRSTR